MSDSPAHDRPAGGDTLILASASPRRAELLQGLDLPLVIRPTPVPEDPLPGEGAEGFVLRLALSKAEWCRQRAPGQWVVAADTAVVAPGGEILGKPAGDEEARRMLRLLSGATHRVLTGVAVAPPGGEQTSAGLASTAVIFHPLSEEEIGWYVASGEPRDKAGAYGIQGRGALFAERIDGSYSNVVGLPLALLYHLLSEAGYPRERFWR